MPACPLVHCVNIRGSKGKGKLRRPKGKGKSKSKRPKGYGKMRRFTMFGKGKSDDAKGKGFGKKGGKPWGKPSPGRSSGMMGCSVCGSPNHNAADCPVAVTGPSKGPGKGFGKKGDGKSYWQEPYYDHGRGYYDDHQSNEPAAAQTQPSASAQQVMLSQTMAANPGHTLFQASALRNMPRISTASPSVPTPPVRQILDQPADTGRRHRQ